jgi:beta-lactamase regulating signal transducer with metallopeptidase domain
VGPGLAAVRAAVAIAPPAEAAGAAAASARTAVPPRPAERLLALLVAAWAAAVTLALLAALREGWSAARLARRAEAATEPAVLQCFARLAAELGTPRARLRVSLEVETPQLTGLLRPTVLLPAKACALDPAELEMAIAHELVHVEQRDLLLGLVPALAAHLFFFHPLARLAAREHALAREAVCDAVVVDRYAPSPRDYGRLLLRLSLPNRAPLRAAVAAATHHTLHRRLTMLLHTPRRQRPLWAWLAAAAVLAVLVPVRLTAREPVPRPAPSLDDRGGERAYLVIHGDGHTMSGTHRDLERAQRWRHDGEDIVWFRRGDGEWVIRDPALVARVAALWEPQRELGARQAELGARQAELGTRQAALGSRQAELGRHQGALAAEQAALAARLAVIAAHEADLALRHRRSEAAALREQRRRLAEERGPIEERMHELGRRMGELGERQGELGSEQGELGEKQSELGARQGELGEQQGQLAKQAEREMWPLLDEAVATGQAERVRD